MSLKVSWLAGLSVSLLLVAVVADGSLAQVKLGSTIVVKPPPPLPPPIQPATGLGSGSGLQSSLPITTAPDLRASIPPVAAVPMLAAPAVASPPPPPASYAAAPDAGGGDCDQTRLTCANVAASCLSLQGVSSYFYVTGRDGDGRPTVFRNADSYSDDIFRRMDGCRTDLNICLQRSSC